MKKNYLILAMIVVEMINTRKYLGKLVGKEERQGIFHYKILSKRQQKLLKFGVLFSLYFTV